MELLRSLRRMIHSPLATRLSGGDRRSIGQADVVMQEVVDHPALLPELVDLLGHDDEVVRMRSVDALEKVSRKRPQLLDGYENQLLKLLSRSEQQEVRWHLLQLLPRLTLTKEQRRTLFDCSSSALQDCSRIVAAEALSALFALATCDPAMRGIADGVAKQALECGAPAVRARARRLLAARRRRQD